ncbi:MAG: sulfatase-like hydrolase/transferase [Verrucomicrobiaceae bacterium]|nr:sulfatase-like hydrolase/transferase [Verrucomicrobiaceae bacterium]
MKSLAACLSSFVILSSAFAAKPNVLFIAVDDMRPELGCYGNTVVKTPNIDRIAARGMVFNHAYCQQAVCSPSRSSLLTGRRPDATKVWDLETHFRVALPDAIALPQHFKENGYYCSALSKIYHHGFEDGRSWNAPHWYPKGYEVDVDPNDWTKRTTTRHEVNVSEYSAKATGDDNDKPLENKKGKGKAGPAFEMSPKSDDELPDGATAAEAVKRIHALKRQGEPFFLAVGFIKPHLPFVSPKKYWDLYDPDKIPLPAIDHLPEGCPEFAGHNNSELHNYVGVPKGNPIPADFAKTLRHGYYAAISFTDHNIGRLLDALEAEGLADNTIIVLWGDHGWQLGDHGLWHKHTNFEIATRAPLLISVPQQKTAGQKCDAPVEFLDVYPTLADVCGLSIPAGLDGKSLKPYLENAKAPMQKVAISQYPRGTPDGPAMGYSIRDEHYRCTFWRERSGEKIVATELYDELADPNETVSLADKPEMKSVIEAMAKHLPPVGSAAPVKKTAAAPTTVKKGSNSDEPRDVRYDRLYHGKTQLNEADYLAGQSGDKGAAKERFKKLDANSDGFVTRDEFIKSGKK